MQESVPVDSHKVNDSYIEKVMRQEISEHGEEITLKKMREIVNADSIYLNRVGEYVNLKRFFFKIKNIYSNRTFCFSSSSRS